jgi:hypothetical protein
MINGRQAQCCAMLPKRSMIITSFSLIIWTEMYTVDDKQNDWDDEINSSNSCLKRKVCWNPNHRRCRRNLISSSTTLTKGSFFFRFLKRKTVMLHVAILQQSKMMCPIGMNLSCPSTPNNAATEHWKVPTSHPQGSLQELV